jgi:thiol-disulfide isomerase/thioredoxin
MKQLLSIAITCTILLACSPKSADTFKLNGSISGAADGEKIYLSYGAGLTNRDRVLDSALIKNGKFSFEGKIDQAQNAVIYIGDSRDRTNKNIASFFIEPNDLNVSLNYNDFANYQLTGSLSEDEIKSINSFMEQIREEEEPIIRMMDEEPDPVKKAEIRELLTPFQERIDSFYVDYIEKHPDSYISAYLLIFEQGKLPYEKLTQIYEGFTERIKKSAYAAETGQEIDRLKSVLPGATAPYFATVDINGDSLKITDFSGKYILIDFWASWCVPCRKGNPHLKELYAKYHDKGLEIIGVSDDDRNPEKWREAVAQDGIEAFHHVLRGLIVDENYNFDRSKSISDKYAIHYLPTKYLIDRDGKIVGQLKEEELDEKLQDIFGK